MRAWDILLFLMAFNAALWIFGEMGMFGATVPGGRLIAMEIRIGPITVSGDAVLAGIAGAIVAASVTVLGTRVTRPIGVVTFAFASFYVFMFLNAIAILSELHIPVAVLTAMTGFNILIFLVAIMQMVSGPWKPYR